MSVPPDVIERVNGVAADVFGVPASSLSAESSPETIDGWDSVQHLNLVLALEAAFGVQIDPEDIESIKTLGAAAEVVARKRR